MAPVSSKNGRERYCAALTELAAKDIRHSSPVSDLLPRLDIDLGGDSIDNIARRRLWSNLCVVQLHLVSDHR